MKGMAEDGGRGGEVLKRNVKGSSATTITTTVKICNTQYPLPSLLCLIV